MYSPYEDTKHVFIKDILNVFYYFSDSVVAAFMVCFILPGIISYLLIKGSNHNVFLLKGVNIFYMWFSNMVESFLGEHANKHFPFFVYLFQYIFFSNLFGLLPWDVRVTNYIYVTFSLAFTIWLIVIVLGLTIHGWTLPKMFVPEGMNPLIVPFLIFVETVSYLFRIVSLSVRLLANMFAGHILIHLVLIVFVRILFSIPTDIPIIAFGYSMIVLFIFLAVFLFELVVCFMQAYIFVVLSLVYLREIYYISH
jgi:F-type H+-transporting ATPase subunit a